MLEIVEIWLFPIPNLLYEEGFIDVDHFLAFGQVLLYLGCVLGHTWPVITLPLYSPVKAYVVVSTGQFVNSLEFCSRFVF